MLAIGSFQDYAGVRMRICKCAGLFSGSVYIVSYSSGIAIADKNYCEKTGFFWE